MIVKSDNDVSPRSLNLQVSGEMDKYKPERYLDSFSKIPSNAFGQRTTSVAMIVVFECCHLIVLLQTLVLPLPPDNVRLMRWFRTFRLYC
jgi:hypothetical protein